MNMYDDDAAADAQILTSMLSVVGDYSYTLCVCYALQLHLPMFTIPMSLI